MVITMSSARAASAARSDSSRRPLVLHALQQRLGARLRERHAPGAQRVEDRVIVVDAEDPQAAVGEAQRQRQADAAETDH